MADPNWTDSGLKDFPYPVAGRNWSSTPGDDTLETQMDVGPSKVRRRSTASYDTVQFSVVYSAAQLTLLDTFRNTTLKSVGTFTMTDPETGANATWRFKGKPARKAKGGGYFDVTIILVRLP